MRSHSKFIALFSAAVMATSTLAVTIESAIAESYSVTKLSGQGGAGEFANPSGVTVSLDGTIYVADQDHFKIKRIVSGNVSEFAKLPATEDSNTNESFCNVFARGTDELWASNCLNSKVYLFDKSGTLLRTYPVSPGFTSSCPGCRDWGGGLAVDQLGGIFLSNEYDQVILRIDQKTGVTSVYAGQIGKRATLPTTGNYGTIDGDAKSATFNIPRGLDVDSKNNLLVADYAIGLIRSISPQRITTTLQGGIPCPMGVAVDAQDAVYTVSEHWCGSIITKIGFGRIYDDSPLTIDTKLNGSMKGQLTFTANTGFAIDKRGANSNSNMYIADWMNHSIKIFNLKGSYVGKYGSEDGFGITGPSTANQIYMFPSQIFPVNDGTYLVLDHFTLRHVSATGQILKVTRLERGCYYTGGSAFLPDGTFFCSQGNLIVARFTDGTTMTIGNDQAGRSDGNSATARFRSPEGMAIYNGSLYVADTGNGQIRRIVRVSGSKDFQVSTVLGTGTWVGAPDVQVRSKANFASPTKIAIDPSGNLYIADGGVDSVFKTSLIQENDVTRVGRGIGSWPSSLIADGSGTVYVSGWGGKLFRIQNNVMSRLAGAGIGNELGTTDTALFNRPTGLSIDSRGNLLIADRDNQSLKKIAVSGSSNSNLMLSASVVSVYLSGDSDGDSKLPPLSPENDDEISNMMIKFNKTGLITRIYQGENISSEARDLNGLELCSIGLVKNLDLSSISSLPFLEKGRCTQKRFLTTFKGFINWPGTGSQTRVIYAPSQGGVMVKMNGKVIFEKWNEKSSSVKFPYDKSATVTLIGGRQYPIEVFYFGSRDSVSANLQSLQLLWSTSPAKAATTEAIEEKYFAPAKSGDSDLISIPIMPTKQSISINLNYINISVSVPENATSVILFSPDFGVSKVKPIIGTIRNGIASFEVSVSSKYAGKKGILQLITSNAAGESKPLKVPVTVPKISTKPVPKATQSARPQTNPTAQISCMKGGIKRTFDGNSCPPGYTKA